MIELKGVRGTQIKVPTLEVNVDTVYLRDNIIEKYDEDGNKYWEYDEIQLTLSEYFKNIIPEMANTFLTNLKMTSVLNVIAVQELFMAAKTVGGNYYKYFESYLVIAVIYFVLCFFFNKIFNFFCFFNK